MASDSRPGNAAESSGEQSSSLAADQNSEFSEVGDAREFDYSQLLGQDAIDESGRYLPQEDPALAEANGMEPPVESAKPRAQSARPGARPASSAPQNASSSPRGDNQRRKSPGDSPPRQVYDGAEVRDVYASAANIDRLGIPSDVSGHVQLRYYIYPTWRSQLFNLISFFILSILTVMIAGWVPATVIKGPLFDIGETRYYLHLPLLVLIPGFVLGKILIYMYDCRYMIDNHGVEAQVGLASMSLRQPRLRFEDIRGVEPNQTIWERILGIGSVLVGSAMTGDVEIVMEGVPNPRAIQVLINKERDRHLHMLIDGMGSEQRNGLMTHRVVMTD
jgi:hypothetical protein